MGRNLARLGRINEALKAYKELNALDHVAVGGIPASLAGQYMRCELLQMVQRDAVFQAEVEVFASELRSSRWHLDGTAVFGPFTRYRAVDGSRYNREP